MATVDPSRLVFVDEAGVLTNMTRRCARAEIGERAYGFAPVNWKRLTVLGALSLSGIVEVKTVPTGTTIPVFLDFLKTDLLPVLRDQKPDAIVVMDNLSAHKYSATIWMRRRDKQGLLANFGESQGCAHISGYGATVLFVAGPHRPSARHLGP